MPFDLTELKRLHEAATRGPWRVDNLGDSIETAEEVMSVNKDGTASKWHSGVLPIVRDYTGRKKRISEDLALIVKLRNHVPEILAAMECRQLLREARASVLFDRDHGQAAIAQTILDRIDAALRGDGEEPK